MAGQIDGDVDAVATGVLGNRLVGEWRHLMEMVRGPHDPGARLILDNRAMGIDMDLKARTIMQFQNPCNQPGHGMIADLGREIANPQALRLAIRTNRIRQWYLLE